MDKSNNNNNNENTNSNNIIEDNHNVNINLPENYITSNIANNIVENCEIESETGSKIKKIKL